MDARHMLVSLYVMPQLDLEARMLARAAEATGHSHGLRAGLAARLASLALRLDREAARSWLSREPS